MVVQEREVELGVCLVLPGSLATPFHRLRVGPAGRPAVVVHGSEIELSKGTALLFERAEEAERGRVIAPT